jgi:hypothetical protein
MVELLIAAPELVASVTLVCPYRVPLAVARDLSMPLNIVSGDRGRAADMIDQVLSNVAHPNRVVLSDYEPMLWIDIALERTDEARDATMDFLARIDRDFDLAVARPADTSGTAAELPYRTTGAGRPLVFFPLGSRLPCGQIA